MDATLMEYSGRGSRAEYGWFAKGLCGRALSSSILIMEAA